MMDDEFVVHLPPEGIHKTARRSRTASQASLNSSRAISPSRTHIKPPHLRKRTSAMSLQSNLSESDRPEILAPTPRRHLLDTSASKHWLRTPPHSPMSSRGASPASQATNHTWPTNSKPNLHSQLSFSSILEEDFQNSPTAMSSNLLSVKEGKVDTDYGMGKRWIRWMHKRNMKSWIIPIAILASTLVKWCVGLGSYSGQSTPPMFGDYEAQRHWMELTTHLPLREWYTYDLPYWGLDYPPLTAYVSWICGKIGSRINPVWFRLYDSRGIENEESKVYMRATVLVCDALVYLPALMAFVHTWQASRSRRTQNLAFMTLLLQPALLLIDFGHFQYNSVMLGFTLLALNFFGSGRDLLGAACFVLSLGFKQMALYYAPTVGTYLLAKCIYLGPAQGSRLFIRLALVTSLTLLLLFLPFLPPFAPISAILDPISRIFPFDRGLFEDKVANFWCASNVAFKWKSWASRGMLVKLSTGLTALGFLPSVLILLQGGLKMQRQEKSPQAASTPMLPLLPYALLTSSMSFFLFSFQVHEKTILVPLLPMTLLMSAAPLDSTIFAWGALANNVGVFSMWPLLRRDGLAVQYMATLMLWNRLIGHNPFRFREQSFVQLLSITVYTACIGLHVLELLITPPSRYPDLFPVLNVLVCTPVFALVWLWSIKSGVEVGWALGGLGPTSPNSLKLVNGESEKVRPSVVRQAGARAMSTSSTEGHRRVPFRASSVGLAQ